jgi:hypothetical protein
MLEGHVHLDELRTEGRLATTPGSIHWKVHIRCFT